VCYYRDKQTTNKFQIAKVTSEGVSVSDPFALETQWGYQVRTIALANQHIIMQGSAADVIFARCRPLSTLRQMRWAPGEEVLFGMERLCVWTFIFGCRAVAYEK